MLANRMMMAGAVDLIPEGLIVLFNHTTIPEGWTKFDSADGKYIVGAGSSYNIGDSDVPILTKTVSCSTAGGHSPGGLGSSFLIAPTTGAQYKTAGSDGVHSHSYTYNSAYYPPYQDVVLIKSNQIRKKLPAKSVLLSTSTIPSLSNVFTEGRLLRSNTTVSQGGSNTENVTVSSAGSHDHNKVSMGGSSGVSTAYRSNSNHGVHSSALTLTITPNVKRKLLSAWSYLLDFNLSTNMIAMWESETPPDGWYICNGDNGTVDLRNYFIECVSSASENTSGSGDNTLSLTLAGEHTGSHTHKESWTSVDDPISIYHDTWSWTHTHSAGSLVNESYIPPYYALLFISYGG